MIKVEENKRKNEDLKRLYQKNTKEHLELWKECFKEETAPDRINEFGIIDPEKYDTDNGILVIGKETNGWSNEAYADENQPLFRQWVYNMANTQEITGDTAKKHPQIWYNLGRWAKFIVNPNIEKEKLIEEKKSALEGLGFVAFTNINKVRGNSTSQNSFGKLSKKEKVKSIITEEIEIIAPKIIILCGIDEDYIGNMDRPITIIKMPHPSARNITKTDMLNTLGKKLNSNT